MKRFQIVIPRDDGGVEVHPMKQWLRQHPDAVPLGLDPTQSTSHQLRLGLRRAGWSEQVTESDIRFTPPGAVGVEAIDAVLGEGGDEVDEQEPTFALEYQLRDFIAQNIRTIQVNGRRLSLYVDQRRRDGVEYPTAVGPIDILATDSSGAFVVFELKRARSPDHAIGQLSRYMGWVKASLASERPLRGVIVAKTISGSLRYAVSVVPNVDLFEYEVSFQLKPVRMMPSPSGG
jgi:endonuclease